MDASAQRQPLGHAYDTLRTADGLLAAAAALTRIGELLGLAHPAVVEDYAQRQLLTAEDGSALAGTFGWDPDIQQEWVAHSLSRVCPVGAVCRVTTKPFAWRAGAMAQLARDMAGRSGQRWNLTPERGIAGGISIPIHLPRCSVGSVGWISRDPELDLDAVLAEHADVLRLSALRMMDLVFAARADEDETLPAVLSLREIECLTFVALGLTDAEIGERLHRSATTARFHVENATAKLGARNRAQAVALACQQGLIGAHHLH